MKSFLRKYGPILLVLCRSAYHWPCFLGQNKTGQFQQTNRYCSQKKRDRDKNPDLMM